ncbi:MAG: 3-deoxy-manno-octulosonate cytidylyltransferase [Chlamydiia bacterium]|nr:3-deoxy-manno-octulosonate cytidylyltransferase [Chlamydiia bacterium]
MSVICIIPARYNSSRFPGKLLATAQGKTVLQRTFESASRCTSLQQLHVATDDERIAEHIRTIGGSVLWTSNAPRDGTERILEALRNYKEIASASYILILQGDQPCTSPATINAIVHAIQSDPEAVLSTAVCPITDREEYLSPHVVKCVFDINYNALYFSRAPIPHIHTKAPSLAYAHIGIYCFRRPFLTQWETLARTPLQNSEDLEQLKILELGHRIKIAVVGERGPSVDTPQDLIKLEQYLCQQNTFSSQGALFRPSERA